MRVYYETNKGLLRKHNEDSFIVEETSPYGLYAVADGMGGHRAGEIASLIAINTIKECFGENLINENFMPPLFINSSIEKANAKIKKESSNNKDYEGMGTTISIAVIDNFTKTAYIGNVGDSRVYLIRHDKIKQITTDHTYVNELVKSGKITLDEAKNHPKRNVITRAVGIDEKVNIDIFEVELIDNDVLLLCSDGLTVHLSDKEILDTIKNYGSSESVQWLIKLSNDNGGTDNITLIVVDNSCEVEYDR